MLILHGNIQKSTRTFSSHKCKHGNVNEEEATHETSFESQTSGETSGLAMPAQTSETGGHGNLRNNIIR